MSINMYERSLHQTHLPGIKVRASQQVLQVNVSLRLRLLQHNHGVSLPEEGAGGTQLSQLNQLQHHLC